MARPAHEDSIYKVSIHKNGGYMYAATHTFTMTDAGKRKYKHVHWGTVTEGNKFLPGKQYLYATTEERGRLIFPKGWDLSEIDKLASSHKKGRAAHEGEDANRLYGDVWLLERVVDRVGLRKDLETVFDGNAEMVNDILTLAYFPFLTGYNYTRVARWQRIERTPSRHELTPTTITRLAQSITEQNRMDLFRCRAARIGKDELCAIDSTTRSAYGHSLADIHWGKNKDHLPLEQTVEVVVYSLDSHMPVYYRTFPGNIPDSRSVETILADIAHAGFPRVMFVTDRGYESLQNLERYILRGQPMIMSVSVHQKFIYEKILEFGPIDVRPEAMSLDLKTMLYYKQYDLDYPVKGNGDVVHKADRMRLNLFFDAGRRTSDLLCIDAEIERQRLSLAAAMEEGTPMEDDKTIRRIYNWFDLTLSETDRKLVSYAVNEKKVFNARKAAGFFAYVTLGTDKTALESLEAYMLRDEQEKYFQQMKGQMCFGRQQVWTEESKNGRLFILFVAQIISSYVRHVWKDSGHLRKLFGSTHDMLDEMRPIRCIEHTGKMRTITPFVGAQVDICEAFGLDIPEGCAPKYRSRKVEPKRRGRPRKKLTVKLES